MAFIDPAQAMGDIVKLARTNPRHLGGIGEPAAAVGAAFPGGTPGQRAPSSRSSATFSWGRWAA